MNPKLPLDGCIYTLTVGSILRPVDDREGFEGVRSNPPFSLQEILLAPLNFTF